MQRKVLPLVERNRIRMRIEKHSRHLACLRIGFGVVHQRTAGAAASCIGIDNEVVDMQMRTACERMNRPHTHDADQHVNFKCADEFIAGMRLTAYPLQEFRFIQ